MAFVHCASDECAKSELDIFQLSPTQTSIEKSYYAEVPPLTALSENAPLEFSIAGNDQYLDLNNTLLYLSCKIHKKDGTNLAADSRVALVNYPIASLFSQVDITIGDRLISQSNNCYPYRAFIETVLNYGDETLKTQFSAGLFYKDTPGHHEATALDGTNLGFNKRAAYTSRSYRVDLLGHIHADLFFQEKLLINGVDVKLKLVRNKDDFCLMSNGDEFKVRILSASLFVKRVQVNPAVRLGHAEALMTSNAKYPIDRVQMKVFSIPTGSRVCNQENLFLGQLPKLVVLGFVDNAAFSGNFTHNPFNFKHNNINFMALYLDGEQIPSKPLQPDFASGHCVREYFQLVETADKRMKDKALLVDREEFAKGYSLFAFNLSPDMESTGHYSLIKTGNLRAEIRFAQPLQDTVNMIVYAVFDNIIEINMRRQVIYDYS
ncbi:uncharacterized protein F54H12.2-like [Erpetoichthys calabaricus]|uniref:uncharacterized protein F54H12.2-like n=1 Tax=Erpetoichthys calabaricus TaxID=27687 RepID=UPI002234CA29|nr:uncharacterized protein F54H12.2-like [Erpetoichthys calabaricus]